MTSLLTTAAARLVITTALSDADLQTIIDREEAEIIRRFGAHQAGSTTVTETHPGVCRSLYLRRLAASVTSVTEYAYLGDTPVTLAANLDYYVWLDQGRIERLYGLFGAALVVVYTPTDDSALRRQVITELVRIAVNQRTPRKAAGYGYTVEDTATAQDWRAAREAQYARLLLSSL